MKNKILGIAFLISFLTVYNPSGAQVNVNINLGAQPAWGPAGYDYVEYYYLPDIETYYYVPGHQYIYRNGSNWVFAPALPPGFKGYDIYRGYKVVINQPKPYLQHDVYKVKYKKFKGAYGRQVILKNAPPGKTKAKPGKAKGKSKGKRKN